MSSARRIYCLRAKQDARYCQVLERHLGGLRHQGLIQLSHAGSLQAGESVAARSEAEIARADLIVVLVSADFLHDEACWSELRAALRSQQIVVKVLLRPTLLWQTGLEDLRSMPADGSPVGDREEAWYQVACSLVALLMPGAAPAQHPALSIAAPADPQGAAGAPQPILRMSIYLITIAALASALGRLTDGSLLPAPIESLRYLLAGITVVLGGPLLWQVMVEARGRSIPGPGVKANLPTHAELIEWSHRHVEWGRDDFEQQVQLAPGLYQAPARVEAPQVPHSGARVDARERPLEERLVDHVLRMERVLLLGAPGAGKTHVLRQLCGELQRWARHSEKRPVPFIVNLNAFSRYQGPLRQWLAEGLSQSAPIPPPMARALLREGRVFLILDGLDQIQDPGWRVLVLTQLNELLDTSDPAVSCCIVSGRTVEYVNTGVALKLRSALELQPLTQHQVQEALAQAGPSAAPLAAALAADPSLAEMLDTPLLLTTGLRALADEPGLQLRGATLEERVQELYDAFLVGLLRRDRGQASHRADQTLRWLRGLATYMCQMETNAFVIDQMQPTAMISSRSYRALRTLAYDVLSGVVTMLILLPVIGLVLGTILGPQGWGLVWGSAFGLVMGVVGAPLTGVVLTIGLSVLALGFWLVESLFPSLDSGRVPPGISLMEGLSWSWAEARRYARACLRWALGYGAIFGLIGGLIRGVAFGVGLGLVFGSIVGVMEFFASGWVVALRQQAGAPSPGLRSTAVAELRKTIAWWALAGVLGLGLGLLAGGLRLGLDSRLLQGLLAGLGAGLVFGRENWRYDGLRELAAHGVLRLLLWRSGCLPLRLLASLEGWRARILLTRRKDGAAYEFLHNTIRDHLSNLTDGRLAELARRIEDREPTLARSPRSGAGRSRR